MILDFNHDDIDQLIKWAEANKITEKEVYQIKLGKSDYPKESHLESKKFDVWYTIEEQPKVGWCHHITLAKTVPLIKDQNYEVISEILNLFYVTEDDVISLDFDGPRMHIFIHYMEKE